MTAQPKLTPARLKALQVLVVNEDANHFVMYSNQTDLRGSIYWQTADWLLDVGYAARRHGKALILTDAGRDRAKAEGLQEAA